MQRKQTEMNKLYQKERDKAYEEFQKKQEAEDAKAGTMKSKMINESRLKIQENRSDQMKTIRAESVEKLKKFVSDRNVYKNLMKQLMVQGLIRLMEENVLVRCLEKDYDICKSVVSDAEQEYSKFMKENSGQEYKTSVEVSKEHPQTKTHTEIGGVVLCCNNNNIILNNTLESRLDLVLQTSTPDIRAKLFPNITNL